MPFKLLFRYSNSLHFLNFNEKFVKSRLRDYAYSSFKQVSKISEKNLLYEEIKALKNLSEYKYLVLQKAGKGNDIVVLNKSDYILKLNRIPEYTSKFKRVDFWGKQSLESYNQYSWKKCYNYLYPSVSKPGILYGPRKICKAVAGGILTCHIILSTIGTITYKLVKFCEKLLKPIMFNEYTIKNYFSFAKEVEEFDPNLVMASFDVKCLFSNIPCMETYGLCVKNPYSPNTY